jgi:hypothetical protein
MAETTIWQELVARAKALVDILHGEPKHAALEQAHSQLKEVVDATTGRPEQDSGHYVTTDMTDDKELIGHSLVHPARSPITDPDTIWPPEFESPVPAPILAERKARQARYRVPSEISDPHLAYITGGDQDASKKSGATGGDGNSGTPSGQTSPAQSGTTPNDTSTVA